MRAPLVLCLLAVGVVAVSAARVEAHPSLSRREALLEQQLAEHPRDPELHLRRAELYREKGSWDAAAASYLRAEAAGADPDRVETALAQVLLEAGRSLAAESRIARVLERNPARPEALVTRARVRAALGRPGLAADDFRRGVELLPRPEPELVLRAMDAQLLAGRPAAALGVADDAMGKIGIVVSIELPAIEIERRLGRHDAALSRLDALLVQAPRHEMWLARRGEILEEAGRNGEARAAWRQVLALIGERPSRRRPPEITALERRLRTKLAPPRAKEETDP